MFNRTILVRAALPLKRTTYCSKLPLRIVISLIFFVCIFITTSSCLGSDRHLGSSVDDITKRYPKYANEIEQVCSKYYLNAFSFEKKYGLNGLILLNELGLNALVLDRKYPRLLKRVLRLGGPESVQAVWRCWAPFLSLQREESSELKYFIDRLANLKRPHIRVLENHPKALPAMVVAPNEVTRCLRNRPAKSAEIFLYLDYSRNPREQVLSAIKLVDFDGPLSEEALRLANFPGLVVYKAHTELLERLSRSLRTEVAFALVWNNSKDILDMYRHYAPDKIAEALLPYSEDRELLASVAQTPHGIRILLKHKEIGANCLKSVGGPAADLVIKSYSNSEQLERGAVDALAEGKIAAFSILYRYQDNQRFREIIKRKYAVAAIKKIARADQLAALKNQLKELPSEKKEWHHTIIQTLARFSNTGEGEIDAIFDRGPEYLHDDLTFVELVPGYDTSHVIRLLMRGAVPTTSEWAFALLDATFITLDALDIGGAAFLAIATPGIPDEMILLSELAAREATRISALRTIKKAANALDLKAVGDEITEELIKKINKNQIDSLDQLAEEAVSITAKKTGIKLSRNQIQKRSQELARALPRKAFELAIAQIVKSSLPDTIKKGRKLLKLSLNKMRVDDFRYIVGPSLNKCRLSILRSGPRKIGTKKISWRDIVPSGAFLDCVKRESGYATVSYLAMAHMQDLLDWIIQIQ